MRIAVVVIMLALALSATALAARGDPQREIRPADQARARSIVLRPGDFNPAFRSRPSSSGGRDDFYCAALDESDLTLTGEAESPTFVATTEFVTSSADVYESRADANASWARGTSKAGEQCLRTGFRTQLNGPVRLVSFRRLAFPRRGQRSVAFRGVLSEQGVRVYFDFVAMQVSRAQVAVGYISALSPPPQGELRRLTGLAAKRAGKAMRGG